MASIQIKLMHRSLHLYPKFVHALNAGISLPLGTLWKTYPSLQFVQGKQGKFHYNTKNSFNKDDETYAAGSGFGPVNRETESTPQTSIMTKFEQINKFIFFSFPFQQLHVGHCCNLIMWIYCNCWTFSSSNKLKAHKYFTPIFHFWSMCKLCLHVSPFKARPPHVSTSKNVNLQTIRYADT